MYKVTYSRKAVKTLEKLDRQISVMIYGWIDKNLVGCEKPRQQGKPLTANKKGYWRYRVGDYRLIAEINDGLIQIDIIQIGHRGDIYQ